MATTKTKKTKKVSAKAKEVAQSPAKESNLLAKDTCKMTVMFNDSVIEKETDNIASSLLEIKPARLYTKVKFVFSNNLMTINRFLFIPMARKVFNNRTMAELFSRGIIKALNGK